MKTQKIFVSAVFLVIANVVTTFSTETQQADIVHAKNAVLSIGVRLRTLLDDNDTEKNFLISPLSASLIIGQIMLGAEGDVLENLYGLVSLPRTTQRELQVMDYAKFHRSMGTLVSTIKKTANASYTLESHNAVFASRFISLNPKFVHECELLYDSHVNYVNFHRVQTAIKEINDWAYRTTHGLIPTLLPEPPSPSTAGIFANAIYFKARWETPFSSELNHVAKWHLGKNKDIDVNYMVNSFDSIPYAENDDCKIVALPYKNREAYMYMILPKVGHPYEYNLKKFAESMGAEKTLLLIKNMKEHTVTMKMPKMQLVTSLSIMDSMKKYVSYRNTTRRTNPHAPSSNELQTLEELVNRFKEYKGDTKNVDMVLTAAAANDNFVVSDIVQQITFSCNEEGTEAAAITAATVDRMGGSKTFLANKPFIFFIRQEATEVVLFWGNLYNPNLH